MVAPRQRTRCLAKWCAAALATVLVANEPTVDPTTPAVAAPQAVLWRTLIRKALRQFARKAGKEIEEELLEETVEAGARLARRYGDDVVKAVAEVGPSAVRAIEGAGMGYGRQAARLLAQYGPKALTVAERPTLLRLIVQHGDEAAQALVRHGATPAPLIRRYGSNAAKALVPVSRRNMRRLMMWLDDGVLEEAGEEASRQFLEIVARRGDQAVDVLWQAHRRGIPALQMVGRYGEDAVEMLTNPRAARLIQKHGADVAGALIRHGDRALDLIETYGDDAARLLRQLDAEEASRLYALLKGSSKLPLDRQQTQLLWKRLRQYGKPLLEFMWQHRKELAVAGVLAAFLANPEPFVTGARDLAEVIAENTLKPLAETPQKVLAPLTEAAARLGAKVGERTHWTTVFALAIAAATIVVLTWLWFVYRARRQTVPQTGTSASAPTAASAERTLPEPPADQDRAEPQNGSMLRRPLRETVGVRDDSPPDGSPAR